MQLITSKETSINKNKLPSSTKKIKWCEYKNKTVIDFGGGKFDNLKEYLKENYNIELLVYDKYNRTEKENIKALEGIKNSSLIICNNVLNVISDNNILQDIVNLIIDSKKDFVISVYEGNRGNKGKQTKKNCYQRNEKTKEYLRYFDSETVTIRKNLITSNINIIK